MENHIMDEVEWRLKEQGITLDHITHGRGRAQSTGTDEDLKVFHALCREIGQIPLDEASEAQIQQAVEEIINIDVVKMLAKPKGLSVKKLLADENYQLLGEVQKTLRSREPDDFNFDNLNINSSRVAELTRQACEKLAQALEG